MYFDTPNESETTFEQLPDGEYRVMVSSHEDRPTKSGTGKLAVIEFAVVGGEFAERTIKKYFNIENQNPVAQKIGRAELKQFLKAVGVTQSLTSDVEFKRAVLNKTLWLTIKQKEQDGRINVEIKKYSDHSEQGTSTVSPQQPAGGVPF